MNDEESAYQAMISRDSRFDGLFYVAVRTTGIYCRPVCPARKPLRKNCHFFRYAEQAEKAGYRPCLRCRPELAPGHAPIDQPASLCQKFIDAIESGLLDNESSLPEIAKRFSLSERQFRRILNQQLGISPQELRQSRRLKLARQLLTETRLPVTAIAFTSGFGSIRQFNSAFLTHYQLAPSAFRKSLPALPEPQHDETEKVRLSYRPPFAWSSLLRFLARRSIKDVEWIDGEHYLRTLAIGQYQGWIRVGDDPRQHCLKVEFSHSLIPVLPVLLQRLRQLFDLSARPDLIAEHLSADPLLAPLVQNTPGLRVPGCFEPFELAVRAILGQQVTVAAATTLSKRLTARFGKPIVTPFPALSRLAPTAEDFTGATADDIGSLGIVGTRINAILALADATRQGLFRQMHNEPQQRGPQLLTELPGIGPWTAQYIAMRALSLTDAFPKEDIALRKALGGLTPRAAEQRSLIWRPWRSYAVMLLWQAEEVKKQTTGVDNPPTSSPATTKAKSPPDPDGNGKSLS